MDCDGLAIIHRFILFFGKSWLLCSKSLHWTVYRVLNTIELQWDFIKLRPLHPVLPNAPWKPIIFCVIFPIATYCEGTYFSLKAFQCASHVSRFLAVDPLSQL